jgi:flagellar hook-basal body complex protein FliE
MSIEMSGLLKTSLASVEKEVQALAGIASNLTSPQEHANFGGSFLQSMKDAVHKVDAQEHAASDQMAAVDAGESDDLVGAMLSSQQASLSFSMLMQVRNKVMGAVEDLVKLPL